jgi:hypothetical protein
MIALESISASGKAKKAQLSHPRTIDKPYPLDYEWFKSPLSLQPCPPELSQPYTGDVPSALLITKSISAVKCNNFTHPIPFLHER